MNAKTRSIAATFCAADVASLMEAKADAPRTKAVVGMVEAAAMSHANAVELFEAGSGFNAALMHLGVAKTDELKLKYLRRASFYYRRAADCFPMDSVMRCRYLQESARHLLHAEETALLVAAQ